MIGRILIWASVVMVVILALLTGLYFWRSHAIERQSHLALEQVQAALEADEPKRALAIINSRPPSQANDTEGNTAWMKAEIEASARLGLISRLQTLFQQSRGIFLSNEKASLLLARSMVHAGNSIAASKIRHHWQEKTRQPHLWHAQEIDALLFDGRTDSARKRLEEAILPGAQDSGRLTRLALLNSTNLARSWNLLADAYEKNPFDADVRSFRGQILETLGSNRLARVEYVAAHVSAPDNIFLRDQLAEFHRRQRNYLSAVQTWTPALSNSPPQFLRLKLLFWTKVARRIELPEITHGGTQEPLSPLTRFLANLPAGRFWDHDGFTLVANNANYSRTRQETFWLQLLELLRENNFRQALKHMQSSPFRDRAYDTALFTTLQRILNYRETGYLNPPEQKLPTIGELEQRHVFIRSLDRQSREEKASGRNHVPPAIDKLLNDNAAPALAFLAAGWIEAGLAMLPARVWSEADPEWIPYTIAQAVRLGRGNQPALAYAKTQPASPNLQLVIGELLLSLGDKDATKQLRTIAGAQTPAGYRAAWLLATAALDAGEFESAAKALENQPLLQTNAAGNELRAKITLASGDTNRAAAIYRGIVDQSIEAKAFLARRAFVSQDYDRARELTEQLLFRMPSNMALRENLRAIDLIQATNRSPAR